MWTTLLYVLCWCILILYLHLRDILITYFSQYFHKYFPSAPRLSNKNMSISNGIVITQHSDIRRLLRATTAGYRNRLRRMVWRKILIARRASSLVAGWPSRSRRCETDIENTFVSFRIARSLVPRTRRRAEGSCGRRCRWVFQDGNSLIGKNCARFARRLREWVVIYWKEHEAVGCRRRPALPAPRTPSFAAQCLTGGLIGILAIHRMVLHHD